MLLLSINLKYWLLIDLTKEAKLELLVSNLIAKYKSPKVILAFVEINYYLRKQSVA